MSERVEILLATYNGEGYLREQLNSLLSQDYNDWIVRACDDASTDGTYKILEEYKSQYPDKFIIKKNEVGYGSAKKNFMNLIKQSTGEYVMCCDQDDIWLPNKISSTLSKMKEVEEVGRPTLVHTDLQVVDDKLNVIDASFFAHSNFRKEFGLNEILIQNFVTGCTMMFNRTLVELMNRIENYENVLMHDWVAAILATGLGKVAFVDQATMLYRQHAVNSVGAKEYGFALFVSKLRGGQMKKSLIDTTIQAKVIVEKYSDVFGEETLHFIQQYATIWEKNKIQRLHFYVKNKVFKKGLPRKLCQMIIG